MEHKAGFFGAPKKRGSLFFNALFFGLGTVGRDMVYTLVTSYLMFYLTDIRRLSSQTLLAITNFLLFARLFDACNDPLMGMIVDRTRTRFGKFKPWIAVGAALSGMLTVLLFADVGLEDGGFIAYFAVVYLLWGISYTMNDISFWSMLPSLSGAQRGRDKIASIARICASLGTFFVVATVVPLTERMAGGPGGIAAAYTRFAMICAASLLAFQLIMLLGVKEPNITPVDRPVAGLRQMLKAITGNDQMLCTVLTLSLLTIATSTTMAFGLYYFKYFFGDEQLYVLFAVVSGGTQLLTMACYPFLTARYRRKTIYKAAVALLILGYLALLGSPPMLIVACVAGSVSAAGQALIQLLMLVFLSDTVEYGQWKLRERHDSVVFSLQPFTNKLGGAVSTFIVGRTVVLTGLTAMRPGNVAPMTMWILKLIMFVFPLVCIIAGYAIYRKKYIIDSEFYERMMKDIAAAEAEAHSA